MHPIRCALPVLLAGSLILPAWAATPEHSAYVSPAVEARAAAPRKPGAPGFATTESDGTPDIPVIVVFEDPLAQARLDTTARIDQVREQVLGTLPPQTYRTVAKFSHIPAASMRINPDALQALRHAPGVRAVNLDEEITLGMTEANALTGTAVIKAAPLSLSGAGQTVAVIDSGINTSHDDLSNDLIGQACFFEGYCDGEGPAEDESGHGTHVSGIITGTGYGVAPDAGIIAVKVFRTGGSTHTNVLNALNYLIGLNDVTPGRVHIINMSLGGSAYADAATCNADNAAYASAFATLNGQGTAIFVGTGNDAYTDRIAAPGCVDGAIGVGSTGEATFGPTSYSSCTDHGEADKVSCYSNTTPVRGEGELLDLLAPGCQITSSWIGSANATYTTCGTSMATPYAAGSAALLRQYMVDTLGVTPTPARIEGILEQTGTRLTDYRIAGSPDYPRVNLIDAIGSLAFDSPPVNLRVTDTTATTIDLAWDALDGATEYRLYRIENVTSTLIGTVSAPATIFTATGTGVGCGLNTYVVRAFDGTAESLPSAPATGTARDCPLAPAGLSLTRATTMATRLDWSDSNPDETAMILERRENDGGYATLQTFSPGTSFSHTDSPTYYCFRTYRYRAVAVRDGDRSPPSNEVRFSSCSPLNDEHYGATTINSVPYSGIVNSPQLATATDDDPVHGCRRTGASRGTHTLWWSFTPDTNGRLTVDTDGSTAPFGDSVLSIFTGAPGDFTAVACNDDVDVATDNYLSRIADLAVAAATRYTIYVSQWSDSPILLPGSVHLNASLTPLGISVTPTSGLVTTEAGGTATFTVVLDGAPTADVTIGLASSDITEGTVSPTGLTFTTADWDQPQTVTVTGADDFLIDGDIAYDIVTAAAVSDDPMYSGMDAADVGVTNSDDDIRLLSVTEPLPGNDGNATLAIADGGDGCTLVPGHSGFVGTEGLSLPAGVSFPLGAAHFIAVGCDPNATLTVTIDLPRPLPPGALLWKLRPNAPAQQIHGAIVGPTRIVYSVQDNGPLDLDASPGAIEDPVAIGFSGTTNPTPVPLFGPWNLPALSLLMLALASVSMRRRRPGAARCTPAHPGGPLPTATSCACRTGR